MLFNVQIANYYPAVEGLHGAFAFKKSAWYPSNNIIAEQDLVVLITENQLAMLIDEVSMILSVAIEFGAVSFTGHLKQ